jgi:hypothetical protein
MTRRTGNRLAIRRQVLRTAERIRLVDMPQRDRGQRQRLRDKAAAVRPRADPIIRKRLDGQIPWRAEVLERPRREPVVCDPQVRRTQTRAQPNAPILDPITQRLALKAVRRRRRPMP